MSPRSRPKNIRASIQAAVNAEARARGKTSAQISRELAMQRLLARVFAQPASPWVLKGGTGLLVRLPGARHSQDIDLLHPTAANLDQAIEELRTLSQLPAGDPFTFTFTRTTTLTGIVTGVQIRAIASIGPAGFSPFSIDLSTELSFVSKPERVQPEPVIEHPELDPPPEFTLYSLPDQIADKVCAMYEVRNSIVSTRYRDLVDLALITSKLAFEATTVTEALEAEQQRRNLTLPDQIHSPGPGWEQGYRKIAEPIDLPEPMRQIQGALTAVGTCLNPLLSRRVATGRWDPANQQWR